MRNEFILSPQNFLNNISAPAYSERSRQSAKSYNPNSENTSHVQDEKFESYMRDLQTEQAENHRQSLKNNKTEQDEKTPVVTDKKPEAENLKPFLTRISSDSIQIGDKNLSEEEQVVFDIYEKMAQILEALEQLKLQSGDQSPRTTAKDTDGNITTSDAESQQDLSELKILSLYADLSEGENADKTPEQVLFQAMEDLRQIIAEEKETLITLNKSPEKLAELQKFIEDVLKAQIDKHNEDMLEELAAQWTALQIIPEQKPQTTKTLQTSQSEVNPSDVSEPSLTARENSAKSRYGEQYKIDRYSDKNSGDIKETQDFPAEKEISPKDKFDLKNPHPSAGNSTNIVPSSLQTFGESLLAPPLINAQGDFIYTDNAVTVMTTTHSGSHQSLTNVLTQSQHASQPHPVTQTVMTSLTKAIKSGDTSELKIQLDPPELGRVEVKMSIDKDNITKVVLTSERAETHTMLQRDAHILEKMLNESGVFSDGSLSFELSDGNNQNFTSGHRQNQNSGHKNQDNYDEIINAKMDWEVDPETGVMHYNILA